MGIRTMLKKIYIKKKLSSCGENVFIDTPICIDYNSVKIGRDVHILRHSRIQNVSKDKMAVISIGDGTGIQYRFSVLAGADVVIGKNVAIASDVFLSAGNHIMNPESEISYGCQPYSGEKIIIEDGCWLGEKVMVMSGVTIGKKSIIGSGGVVTKNIPPYSIAVGNPAKVIKKYNFETHKWERVD